MPFLLGLTLKRTRGNWRDYMRQRCRNVTCARTRSCTSERTQPRTSLTLPAPDIPSDIAALLR